MTRVDATNIYTEQEVVVPELIVNVARPPFVPFARDAVNSLGTCLLVPVDAW